MVVDTDAGTVRFLVNGAPHPHACAGVTRAVRPAVFFYNRSEIRVHASGEAPATPNPPPPPAAAAAAADAHLATPVRPERPVSSGAAGLSAAAAMLQHAAPDVRLPAAGAAAAPAFGFDLELMRAAERSRRIIDELGGVAALAKVERGLLTFQPAGSEYLAVPMEPAISSGQHSFTFCVRRDSNDGSGVGLIADGRESCLKGLGFPNNGQHGIWWLRRFCSQVYSAERNEGRGATFRTGAVVTIKLDMDVGEAAFVVDGEELPYKARNIVGTVRPCVYAYGTGMRIQVEAVGASIGSGVASGARPVAEGLGGIELAPRASPTERLAAEARAWGLPPGAAAAQLGAAGGDAQLAVARLFSTAVARAQTPARQLGIGGPPPLDDGALPWLAIEVARVLRAHLPQAAQWACAPPPSEASLQRLMQGAAARLARPPPSGGSGRGGVGSAEAARRPAVGDRVRVTAVAAARALESADAETRFVRPYPGQCGLLVQDDGGSTPFKASLA